MVLITKTNRIMTTTQLKSIAHIEIKKGQDFFPLGKNQLRAMGITEQIKLVTESKLRFFDNDGNRVPPLTGLRLIGLS